MSKCVGPSQARSKFDRANFGRYARGVDIEPATPQAAENFAAARRELFRAIDFDVDRGASANRIAEWAHPAVSRPVVHGYVAARKLRASAHQVLREAGLNGPFGVDITGQIGRGSRTVRLVLAADPVEIEHDPEDLVALAGAALDAKNIELVVPVGHDSAVSALWEGEGVPLRRTDTEAD